MIVAVSAVAAAAFAIAQLRNGVLPTWDTVSYWSGAEAIRHGDLFGSHVQPSFSNFTVIDFLDRSGRLPFVDFPVGYPLLIAALGALVGTKAAMAAWAVIGVAAVASLVTVGSQPRETSLQTLGVRAMVGVGLVWTSPFRIVTRAGMTEPLFCAVALALVLALIRYRRTGAAWPSVAVLGVVAGLLRFMGAGFALLVFAERQRRTRKPLESLGWAGVVAMPAIVNALWASRAGGGHSARVHGVDGHDMERLARSVGGWVDARQANVALTFFSDEGARWWAWVFVAVWLGALIIGGLSMCGLRVVRMPPELEICLAAAGLLTIGLFAGMFGFDDLVNPDNRVMLPMGVLTIAGLAWSLVDYPTVRRPAAYVAVGAWLVLAVFPRGQGDPYLPVANEPATTGYARSSAAAVVVSTDADLMTWYTGIPAAYPPKGYMELTGETADEVKQWAELPCALEQADGVLIVPAGGGLLGFDASQLDSLVAAGALIAEPEATVTLYRPAPDICWGSV